MYKAFKYRAYPNKTTIENSLKVIEQCRILYNLCVWHREDAFKKGLKYKTMLRNVQSRMITELKKNQNKIFYGFPWWVQEDLVLRVDKAFDAFFKRCKRIKKGEKLHAGYPKAKKSYSSFGFRRGNWSLENNILTVPNIGRFKLRLHRQVEGEIKWITIKTKNGKWYVSFSCKNVHPERDMVCTGKEIGIDLGYSCFLTDSEGRSVYFPKYYHAAEKRLKRLHRSLNRKNYLSSRWRQVKKTLHDQEERVANCRRYFFYDVANSYLSKYDVIKVEDLDIKMMIWQSKKRKIKKRTKLILDAAWGTFLIILNQKAQEYYGKSVVKVAAEYTTMTCNICGRRKKVKISEMEYVCVCGHREHRKLNAAKNILAAL